MDGKADTREHERHRVCGESNQQSGQAETLDPGETSARHAAGSPSRHGPPPALQTCL